MLEPRAHRRPGRQDGQREWHPSRGRRTAPWRARSDTERTRRRGTAVAEPPPENCRIRSAMGPARTTGPAAQRYHATAATIVARFMAAPQSLRRPEDRGIVKDRGGVKTPGTAKDWLCARPANPACSMHDTVPTIAAIALRPWPSPGAPPIPARPRSCRSGCRRSASGAA